VLEVVHKRLDAEETKEYAARKEEATERRDSQACILSGGVYLRHRPRKASSPKICMPDFPDRDTIAQEQKAYNMRRSGVLACKKLFLFPTHNCPSARLDTVIHIEYT
jgi:hypothetical protein